jgi:hypothetical protein
MGFPPVTLWADGVRRCVLRRTDGRFEVLLYDEERIVELFACRSEHDARDKAQAWLAVLEENQHR